MAQRWLAAAHTRLPIWPDGSVKTGHATSVCVYCWERLDKVPGYSFRVFLAPALRMVGNREQPRFQNRQEVASPGCRRTGPLSGPEGPPLAGPLALQV